MCGIAGFLLAHPAPEAVLAERVSAINTALAHRGPDGAGVWCVPEAGLALAQRRLAIVDLSPTGAQPMLSHAGRFAMTYNGEIYNFRELRQELESAGVRFRGTSDSEVLLQAWEAWGADATLARLNGMFAIAIWDRRDRVLTLARDRFGIKPLVWFQTGEGIFFASELRALLNDPACPHTIDPASVTAYLRHGCVPAPWTIMAGVQKLEPGTVLTVLAGQEPAIRRYWSPADAVRAGQAAPFDLPWEQIVAEGEALLSDAVERQMIADVPLGAFLSGGIDSSLVAALMQRRAGRKIDTFTIGFEEAAWDESPHAAAVAAHLGTQHHTLMTSGRAALDTVADMALVYDEPFADSSQIPTTLLARMVRKHVTVALSGDGGDEVFAGYQRYGWGQKLAATQARVPAALRHAIGAAAAAVSPAAIDGLLALAGRGQAHGGHKLQRLAQLVASPDFLSGYRQFLSLTATPEAYAAEAKENVAVAFSTNSSGFIDNSLARMQLVDAMSYLPDDILVKTDRASMSVGLEVRVPLLDHRVWEWAMRIAPAVRQQNGHGKRLLRDVLNHHVPSHLTDRPKAGFAVPLARWLRGELRDFAEPLLSPTALANAGLFNVPAVQLVWQQHLAGRYDHGPLLWAIIMLQSWRATLARHSTVARNAPDRSRLTSGSTFAGPSNFGTFSRG